jgi:tRNA pseudouridine55 synthase
VQRLRRALGTTAVGHAGTLDPMATGVLVVAVGEATKLVPWLTDDEKSYEATIALGVETDTLDAEGTEVRRLAPPLDLLTALERSRPGLPHALLAQAFAAERARTHQLPPAYSAIRSGGERAYDRARRGEAVELAEREVRLARVDLVACRADPPELGVSIDASKGYYVRALARDLAAALGTVGHLTALRRTRSGAFSIAAATALEAPADELRSRIEPLARAAALALPVVRLSEAGAREARHGRPVDPSDMDPPVTGDAAWIGPDEQLVAIGRVGEDGRGRVTRGMVL